MTFPYQISHADGLRSWLLGHPRVPVHTPLHHGYSLILRVPPLVGKVCLRWMVQCHCMKRSLYRPETTFLFLVTYLPDQSCCERGLTHYDPGWCNHDTSHIVPSGRLSSLCRPIQAYTRRSILYLLLAVAEDDELRNTRWCRVLYM